MAVEGRLPVGGVADLLSLVWEQERTGLVDVTAGGVERRFVLSSGDVVYVGSSDPGEKLPVRLVARGVASREAVVAAAKAGPDLRASLAASGALAPAAHDAELRALVAEVVARAFPLADGKYAITDTAEITLPGVLESNPMVTIFWRAARQAPAEFAARFLGDRRQRVVRAPTDEVLNEVTDLAPAEAYLLSRIDGYSSVVDLESIAPIPPEEVHRLLLAATVIGLVDVAGRPGLKLPKPARSAGTKGRRKPAAARAQPSATSRPATGGGTVAVTPAAPAPAAPKEGLEAARELFHDIAEKDHYGVLGVKPAADEAEIRKAYYGLARTYHPDRFGKDLAGADRQLVEDLFARIGEAFSVLSDAERRTEYDQRLKSGAIAAEMKEEKKPVDKREMARESYDKARALLASGDRARAMRFLEHAVETDKDTWEYRMALARLLMSDTRTRKRAEPHLQEAIRIDQSKADAYHQLGVLYRAAGVRSRALEVLRQGLKWDAGHAGILQEIDELEGRSGGDAGLLGGLFGKKK